MPQAIQHFHQAIDLAQNIESPTIENFRSMAHYNIGCSYLKRRDHARALKHSKFGTG